MNAKYGPLIRGTLCGLLLCNLTPVCLSAAERELVDLLTTPIEDPLRTNPDSLGRVPRLPGDQDAVFCPDTLSSAQSNLTLEAAIDAAICHNAQLRTAGARIDVQAAQLGQARSAYLPTIGLGANKLRQTTTQDSSGFDTQQSDTTRQDGHTFSANLNWLLLDGGGRAANNRMADYLLDAAQADYGAELQRTLRVVSENYFNAKAALALTQARLDAQKLAQQTVDSVKRLEARGVAAHADTLQAQEALARAKLAYSRAQGDYEKSLYSLNYSMGVKDYVSQSQFLRLSDELPQESGSGNTLHGWLTVALEQNQKIHAAQKKRAATREKIIAVRSEGLPTLSLSVSNYTNGIPNQSLSSSKYNQSIVGLNLNIPLFDGFSNTYKVREQQAQLRVLEATQDDVENQILSEVAQAYSDVSSSIRNQDAAQTLARVARDTMASRQRGFTQGTTDLNTLLNVQSALADAEQEAISAAAAVRSARLKLISSAGILGRKEIQ